MIMGCAFTKRSHKLAFSRTVTCQTSPFEGVQPSRDPSSLLRITSHLVCYKIFPLQIASLSETSIKYETPELRHSDKAQRSSERLLAGSPVQKKSGSRVKGNLINGKKVTLYNLEENLRGLWYKDPTLGLDDFYEIAKKLFGWIEDERKHLVNLNKRWCSRLLKSLKGVPVEVTDYDKAPSEVYYDIFSEPESAQVEPSVGNSSALWRKHTLKLLHSRYPKGKEGSANKEEGGRKEGKEEEEPSEEVCVVNEAMVKTLGNRKQEVDRLRDDLLGRAGGMLPSSMRVHNNGMEGGWVVDQ